MTPPQKHLATALLSAGLSQTGYIKATTIMSLEDILRIMEKDNGVRRNPEGISSASSASPPKPEPGATASKATMSHELHPERRQGRRRPELPRRQSRRSPRRASQGSPRPRTPRRTSAALVASLTPEQKKVADRQRGSPQGHPDHGRSQGCIQGQPNGLQLPS